MWARKKKKNCGLWAGVFGEAKSSGAVGVLRILRAVLAGETDDVIEKLSSSLSSFLSVFSLKEISFLFLLSISSCLNESCFGDVRRLVSESNK